MLFGAASELVAELASRVIDSQELGFLGENKEWKNCKMVEGER